jgi:hypothetical protein
LMCNMERKMFEIARGRNPSCDGESLLNDAQASEMRNLAANC